MKDGECSYIAYNDIVLVGVKDGDFVRVYTAEILKVDYKNVALTKLLQNEV